MLYSNLLGEKACAGSHSLPLPSPPLPDQSSNSAEPYWVLGQSNARAHAQCLCLRAADRKGFDSPRGARCASRAESVRVAEQRGASV
eukprot:3935740-Rhodomonas_salina.4